MDQPHDTVELAGVDAEARYLEAAAIERARLGDAHPELALTTNSLGLLCFARGDLDCAAARYRDALAIFAAAGDSREAIAAHNLGLVHARRGQHRAAIELFDRALAIYRRTVGPDHARARATEAARQASRDHLPGTPPPIVSAGPAPPPIAPPPRPVDAPRAEPRLAPSTPPPAPAPPPDPAEAGTYGASRAWDTP